MIRGQAHICSGTARADRFQTIGLAPVTRVHFGSLLAAASLAAFVGIESIAS